MAYRFRHHRLFKGNGVVDVGTVSWGVTKANKRQPQANKSKAKKLLHQKVTPKENPQTYRFYTIRNPKSFDHLVFPLLRKAGRQQFVLGQMLRDMEGPMKFGVRVTLVASFQTQTYKFLTGLL